MSVQIAGLFPHPLKVGQELTIPTKLGAVHYTSSTYAPRGTYRVST